MFNEKLKGTYLMTTIGSCEIYNYNTQDDEVADSWEDTYLLSFDGEGEITFLENNGKPFSYPPMPYSLDEHGIMSENNVPIGIVSSDGSLFSFVSTDDGPSRDDLVIHIGVKTSSGMSNASLQGTYLMTTVGTKEFYNQNFDDEEVVDAWADTYLLSLDGNGRISILEENGKPASYPQMPYKVNENGIMTENDVPIGIVNFDGSLFSFVGSDGGPLEDDLVIHIAIKTSSSMSNANLKGTYLMTTVGYKEIYNHNTQDDEVVDSWEDTYLLSFDGEGEITFLENNGKPCSYPPMPYSVNENGIMTENGVPIGIVTSDGNIFSFIGSTDDNSLEKDLVIHLGIRISNRITGDINSDGIINITDVLLMLKNLTEK